MESTTSGPMSGVESTNQFKNDENNTANDDEKIITKNGLTSTVENNLNNDPNNGSMSINDSNNSSTSTNDVDNNDSNNGSMLAGENANGTNGTEQPSDLTSMKIDKPETDKILQNLVKSEVKEQNYVSNPPAETNDEISQQLINILEEEQKKNETMQGVIKEEQKKNEIMESEINKLRQVINKLENERNYLYNNINNTTKQLSEVTKVNEELKIEAANYQSKLGDAKNFKLSDDDPNNTIALTRDIEELQDKINLYARVKKGVTLNLENAKEGLKYYGCSLDNTNGEESEEKILIKWLLQRVLIDQVIKTMDVYMQCRNEFQLDEEGIREMKLISLTDKMIERLSEFEKSRDGIDEVTQVVPIKLRQQIYAILGDRGFANIKTEQQRVHPLINVLCQRVDNVMSKFRTFNDEEKKKENDKSLPSIISEIIKIFFFRLKVQEPVASYRWFNRGDKIDPTQMTGLWDENIDQWFVDICYFPLIGIDLDDENNRKILFPAKVAVYKEKKGSIFNNIGNNLNKLLTRSPATKQTNSGNQQTPPPRQNSQPTTRQNSSNSSNPRQMQQTTKSINNPNPPRSNPTTAPPVPPKNTPNK